jgi:micrococcal nuclease
MRLLLLSLLVLVACASAESGLEPHVQLVGPFPVTPVVDGDTIELEIPDAALGIMRAERVRLIGIDTPETVHPDREPEPFGPEASAFAKDLLEDREVMLELDVEPRDRFGRLLAYVYLEDADGAWSWGGRHFTQANLAIMQSGLAQTLTIPPNVRYVDLYLEALREAREAGRGMWAEMSALEVGCTPVPGGCPESCPVAVSSSGIFHVPGGQFYARLERPAACYATPEDAMADGYRQS